MTVLILLVCLNPAFGQVKDLFALYQKKDFPALSRSLAGNQKQLTRAEKNIFKASIYNAYGKAAASNQLLRKIKTNPKTLSANDTLQYIVLKTRYDNYVKLFDYEKAAQTGSLLLANFKSFLSPEELEEEAEAVKIWRLLRKAPRQKLEKLADTEIQLTRDKANLLNIPVQVSDNTYNMVFDSGAGLSVVSESYARQLNFKPVSDSTVQIESGITGLATPVRLAVAENLKMGNIQVRNAVFLVFPDSALSFGGGVYKINGIIGFPIIRDFGTITFTDQTKLSVYKTKPQNSIKPNMIVDALKPVIYLTYQNQELPYTFDTGAGISKLSDNFFNRFKTIVEAQGTPTEREAGGTGGSRILKGYTMPELTFISNNTRVTLKNLFVSQEPISTNGEIYYGNIGQNFIKQFRKMTISFEDAYILFQ